MANRPGLDAVRELYDGLPQIKCKGLCFNSCGPIGMSPAEHARIVDLGVHIPVYTTAMGESWERDEKDFQCPALTAFGRCSVYDDRPLICRLWGVAESMPCPYGCEVQGEILSDVDAIALLREAEVRGGGDDSTSDEDLRAIFSDPVLGPLFRRLLRGDKSVIPQLETLMHRNGS